MLVPDVAGRRLTDMELFHVHGGMFAPFISTPYKPPVSVPAPPPVQPGSLRNEMIKGAVTGGLIGSRGGPGTALTGVVEGALIGGITHSMDRLASQPYTGPRLPTNLNIVSTSKAPFAPKQYM